MEMPRIAIAAIAFTIAPAQALGQGKACALATAAEVEAALGGKPAALTPGSLGEAQTCSTRVGDSTVMIRHFKRTTDASGEKEKAAIESLKKMGAKVEVRKSGPITCFAASMAQGHSTSCSVAKPPLYAVVEASNAKQAVPIDRLLPIAEKMAGRF